MFRPNLQRSYAPTSLRHRSRDRSTGTGTGTGTTGTGGTGRGTVPGAVSSNLPVHDDTPQTSVRPVVICCRRRSRARCRIPTSRRSTPSAACPICSMSPIACPSSRACRRLSRCSAPPTRRSAMTRWPLSLRWSTEPLARYGGRPRPILLPPPPTAYRMPLPWADTVATAAATRSYSPGPKLLLPLSLVPLSLVRVAPLPGRRRARPGHARQRRRRPPLVAARRPVARGAANEPDDPRQPVLGLGRRQLVCDEAGAADVWWRARHPLVRAHRGPRRPPLCVRRAAGAAHAAWRLRCVWLVPCAL